MARTSSLCRGRLARGGDHRPPIASVAGESSTTAARTPRMASAHMRRRREAELTERLVNLSALLEEENEDVPPLPIEACAEWRSRRLRPAVRAWEAMRGRGRWHERRGRPDDEKVGKKEIELASFFGANRSG